MWFSKVPGYIFDKQKTPYLTEAKELTLAQSQYELAAYGVFVGTMYSIIGLAAALNLLQNATLIHLIWLFVSLGVIGSIFNVIRKYEIIANASFVSLTILLCFLLLSIKYGWRVTKIVAWQRYTGEFKTNNYKKV